MPILRTSTVLIMSLSALLLGACGNNKSQTSTSSSASSTPDTITLKIVLSNLTTGQPLSPALVVAGDSNTMAWKDGETASLALEKLAEGGNIDELSKALKTLGAVAEVRGDAPLMPGTSKTFTLSYPANSTRTLSIASMLVATNDGFTGLNALPIGTLTVGAKMELKAPAWDAGTENNTESMESLAPPVGGKEGFNATRDDVMNLVHYHPGVISKDDGLSSSILSAKHRFDNPMMSITIERTQ